MPSISKSQSRYMHMLENAKSGKSDMSKLSPKAQEAAKNMSFESLKHYTKTKSKNLPDRVEKKASDYYTEGFVKRAFEHGFNIEETKELMKKAGFTKEAFGFLLPLAETLLGGFGAEALGGMAARRAAANAVARKATLAPVRNAVAGAFRENPELVKNFNVDMTPKIKTWGDRGNQLIDQTGAFHQKHQWVLPTIGSMAVPAALNPINESLDPFSNSASGSEPSAPPAYQN